MLCQKLHLLQYTHLLSEAYVVCEAGEEVGDALSVYPPISLSDKVLMGAFCLPPCHRSRRFQLYCELESFCFLPFQISLSF